MIPFHLGSEFDKDVPITPKAVAHQSCLAGPNIACYNECMSVRGYLLVAAIVLLGGVYLFITQAPRQEQTTPVSKEYINEKYGLAFSYSASYTLTEHHASGSALRNHHTIVLIPTADLPAPLNGEGPPSITIDAYQNDLDHQTTEGWIRGSSESNFKLGDGTLASTTIDGTPALSYRWSGLYDGTTIAVATPKWIYAFSVTYMEMGAPIIQDFVSIRDSVRIGSPQSTSDSRDLDPTPRTVTLSGTYVCLPHLDTTGPQTMECAFGLKTDDGVYYAVNFGASASAMEQFQSGAHVTAEGFVVIKEALSSNQWAKYNMKGIFTVTKIVRTAP
jgi:hypothetical protein